MRPGHTIKRVRGDHGRLNSMDLEAALRQLYAERARIEHVITLLEQLRGTDGTDMSASAVRTGRRRGRRSMGAKERQEVSKRMKKYWAGRRSRREDGTLLN